MATDRAGPTARLRVVVFGEDDPRVRATWRVLLAMPILWSLTGAVLTGNIQSFVGFIPSGQSVGSGVVASLLHAGFLLVALLPWARYIDRQSLANYGISVSRAWVRDGLVGFLAVVTGQTVWIGISSVPSGKSIQVWLSLPDESVIIWLVLPLVALVLHAAVQHIVFFRVILENAAEGLHSRGLNAGHAGVAAVVVAVVFFVAMHGRVTPLRILDLVVVGGIFGLMYLHTGALGLGIGAHFGAFYGGTIVFAVIQVTGSTTGVLGMIDQYGFPKMVMAYLLVLAWMRLQRGEIPVQRSIARWDGR